MRRPILSIILILFAATAAAGEWKPAKARMTRSSGEVLEVFVIQELMESVRYSTDPDGKQVATSRRKEISRVEYDERAVDSIQFFKGQGLMNRTPPAYAEAVATFTEAADKAKFEWLSLRASQLIAECQFRQNAIDAAVAALDKASAAFPAHPWMVEGSGGLNGVLVRKGEVLLAAKKLDAAQAAFQVLVTKASDFGKADPRYQAAASAQGLYGLGQVAEAQGKYDVMATHLGTSFKALSIDADPQLYGRTGLKLAYALEKSGKGKTEALPLLTALRYQPVSGEVQGQAFLNVARLLVESGQILPALDNAILAAVVPETTVSMEAKKLARSIYDEKIKGNAQIPDADKAEYLDYVNKL